MELCLQFYARVVFGYLRLYSYIWCDMEGSRKAPFFISWQLGVANYPVFHVKHWAFVEGSGDGLPDADPDVVTLYCAEVVWKAWGGVAYCGAVSLFISICHLL